MGPSNMTAAQSSTTETELSLKSLRTHPTSNESNFQETLRVAGLSTVPVNFLGGSLDEGGSTNQGLVGDPIVGTKVFRAYMKGAPIF